MARRSGSTSQAPIVAGARRLRGFAPSRLAALPAALLLAAFAASSAQAGAISEASSWTASDSASWGSYYGDSASASNPAPGTLDLAYFKGNYFCAGCGSNSWSFSTVAQASGTGSFDYTFTSFNAWYEAYSTLGIYLNGNLEVYGYDSAMGAKTLSVHAGDTILIQAYETNYDGTGFVDGTVELSNFTGVFAVPEPASMGMFSVGLLAIGALLRRRRA